MIIVSVDSGLCNQMYFFATGYALAKEWDEELVINPCIDGNAEWTYLLDEFCVPPYKKIIYPARYNVGKGIDKIIPEIRETAVVIDENYFEQVGDYLTIPKQKFRSEYPGKDVYLKGTFLMRQMFTKYLPDLRKIFTLRESSAFVREFEEKIKNITAVGVHIRRQGFTVLGDDNGIDFFMASIVYMRQRFENARFYIFSDDLEYVKENLGTADDIFYIDAMNGYYGDIEEFVCLTKCHHYILTRRSTYGRMAEILNPSDKKKSVLFGSNTWNDSEERFHFMPQEEVFRLSRLFRKRTIGCSVTEDNLRGEAAELERKFITFSLDSETITFSDRKNILYRKAQLYAKQEKYGQAVHLCRLLEDQYGENSEKFHAFFGNLLCRYGSIRESLIEYGHLQKKIGSNGGKKHYIIVQFGNYSSQYLSEMQMIGLILGRMGNDISFVFKRNELEVLQGATNAAIIAWENNVNHKWMDMILKKGFSICRFYYGYPCYEYAFVLNNKKHYLQMIAEKYPEEETVMISRDPEMISKDVSFRKVFVDFSHPFDEAYLSDAAGERNIAHMYDCADIVVTGKENYFKKGQQVIRLDDRLLEQTVLGDQEKLPYYKPTVYTDDYLDIALKIESACRI